jgi:hypothetical protein
MAEHLGKGGNAAESFLKRAEDVKRRGNLLRQAAMNAERVTIETE